jgi:hypothetical protein
MYLKPAYDTMINGTKYRLNEMLGETIKSNSNNQFIFIAIQVSLILFVLLIIVFSIYRFLGHMEEVMKTVFQL